MVSKIQLADEENLEIWCDSKIEMQASFVCVWKIERMQDMYGAKRERWEAKEEIMKKKGTLRAATICTNHNRTWIERRNRQKVIQKAIEAKEEGKGAKIRYNRVTIHRCIWMYNEKEDRGEEVKPGRNGDIRDCKR